MKQYMLLLALTYLFACSSYDAEHEIIASPAGLNAAQPNLFDGKDGLYMSWQQDNDSSHFLYFSKFMEEGWSDPEKLAEGSNWFINWADYPTIAVNDQGTVLSSFLPRSGEGTYAYDINVVLPDTTFKLHDDTTETEHGFISAAPMEDGKFIVSWLDGRNTGGSSHNHSGAMNLRAAIVNSSGEKEQEWLLDEKVCDCCQTGVAVTNEGPIVAYRNRSEHEIRDIFITKFRNGQWTEPEPVATDNWEINGCPVNGPRIKAKDSVVAIAYFTAAQNKPSVKMVISEDHGETFSAPITIDTLDTIGRIDLEIMNNNEIWVSWINTAGEKSRLKAANFSLKGDLKRQEIITEIDASRISGFPQMEKFQKNLYFAWTKPGDTTSIVLKRIIL